MPLGPPPGSLLSRAPPFKLLYTYRRSGNLPAFRDLCCTPASNSSRCRTTPANSPTSPRCAPQLSLMAFYSVPGIPDLPSVCTPEILASDLRSGCRQSIGLRCQAGGGIRSKCPLEILRSMPQFTTSSSCIFSSGSIPETRHQAKSTSTFPTSTTSTRRRARGQSGHFGKKVLSRTSDQLKIPRGYIENSTDSTNNRPARTGQRAVPPRQCLRCAM